MYAALCAVSEELNESIERFNATHEDVRIEVRDYSDENGVERLAAELALGQVPDIMEMHRLDRFGRVADTAAGDQPYRSRPADEYWMPYRQMAQKGYLEDLWPYIENDPDLGLDGILLPPLKAAEVNGGLYMIFPEVSITTLIGPEVVTGDRMGWTFEELMETYSTMPEDSTILRCNASRQDVFSMLCAPSLAQYVDAKTGKCSFDSQGFRDMVELLRSFPEEFKTTLSPEGVRAEIVDRMLSGRQLLEAVTVGAAWYLPSLDVFFGTPAAYAGYPTEDGSLGSFFNLHGSKLAMSATCRNKEAAWDFMRQIIAKKYDYNTMVDMRTAYGSVKICTNLANYKMGNDVDLK